MKILVVDDEVMMIEFLRRSLNKDGHTVETASDGLQAYRKAVDNSYDIIVLDIIMPAKNGVDVCRDLRDTGIKTPVLMLSSRDSEEARVQGLDAGADDYMIKPFSYTELAARLRALNRRSTAGPDEDVVYDDLVLDPATRRVTVSDAEISLRPKEYGLLLCLLQSKGEAVSKSDILHKVWGVNQHNASTRLEVCIKSLRAKLKSVPGATTPEIRNVRSFGYIIE